MGSVSHTLDLYSPDFPHGTVDGYRSGCHGSACGAVIACRDVYRRYQGDFTFRRQIDAGVTAEDIYAAGAAEAEAVRERDRAAARAERRNAAASNRPKNTTTGRARSFRRVVPTPAGLSALERHGAEITRLRSEGLNDRLIGEQIGLSQARVGQIRRELGIMGVQPQRRPRPEHAPRVNAGADVARLHAEGLRDGEIAERLGLRSNYVGNLRRDLGLPVIPAPRAERRSRQRVKRPDRRPDVAAAHSEGLTDRQIGERVGISVSEAARLRRDLGLKSNRPAPWRRNPEDLQPHGTNASYARGCRCEACHRAQREYYREWARKKRAEGIPPEHHGTPYGYQLGCRGRKACPAEMSCTDASLAEERRRRREAGIPAQPDRVDAEPIRAHVRSLMDAGMSVFGIADTAEVSLSGLKTLLYGRSGDRKGEYPANIEAAKAEKLLAVKAGSA